LPLSAGQHLGPYEILAPLGAGGMGEVYRARDTRLGREVAVKVLPAHLASDPELGARLEREARAASALNHPHICTLHDVGRQDGVAYIVMELIQGETLARRLERGPLPMPELLKIGIEIADALDRAHRQGIVHRDLKPGNIMLTKSGAKLMDFGLARDAGLAPPPSDLSNSPTRMQPLTSEGSIVGTFQYMAPEQLEGRVADARTDLFAFGCVLYEMASGRRAFDGASQASLIASILKDTPRPLTEVMPLTPPALDQVVRACLAKDADDRIQTAHDVKLQLQWIAEGGSRAGVPAAVAGKRRGRERLAWAVGVIALIVAAALGATLLARPRSSPARLVVPLPDTGDLTIYGINQALSPDGRRLAVVTADTTGTSHLWVRNLETGEYKLLTDDAYGPFWSPDGRWIGYCRGDKTTRDLCKIGVDGGTPVSLAPVSAGRGGSWAGDVIIYAPNAAGPIFRIASGGGDTTAVTHLDPTHHETGHRVPRFLPDGRHFLYVSLPGGPQGYDVCVGDLGSTKVKRLLTASSAAVYASGYLLFERGNQIMAQRFDPGGLRVIGQPQPVAPAPPLSDMSAELPISVSREGRLVLLARRPPNTRLQWFDRAGHAGAVLTLPEGRWLLRSIAPDGRRAAVMRDYDVWVVDLDRSLATRVTSGEGLNTAPVWSPDGSQLAFESSRSGREEVWIVPAGGGEARLLPTTDDQFKNPMSWTKDWLVFNHITRAGEWDISAVRMPDGGKPIKIAATAFTETGASLSRDQRWLVYDSNESGREEAYVRSFPEATVRHQISASGAGGVGWSLDGREITYGGPGPITSVEVTPNGNDLTLGPPHRMFAIPDGANGLSFTPDGRRILISLDSGKERRELQIILDWPAALTR